MSRLDTLKKAHKKKMENNGMCFLRCPETSEDKQPYKLDLYSCNECGFSDANHKTFTQIMGDIHVLPL